MPWACISAGNNGVASHAGLVVGDVADNSVAVGSHPARAHATRTKTHRFARRTPDLVNTIKMIYRRTSFYSSSAAIRVRRWSSGRRCRCDATEDSVRLIGKSSGVEERRLGLVGVTITKHQRPQTGDSYCPTVGDHERSLRSCQLGAVWSKDVYLPVAKVADQHVPCQGTESGRCDRHSPRRIERAGRCKATDEVATEVEYVNVTEPRAGRFVVHRRVLLRVTDVQLVIQSRYAEGNKACW